MTKTREIGFDDLRDADLVVDAVYRGGVGQSAGSDALAALLPVGNQGGFRIAGSRKIPGCKLAVIFSNLAEPNWPDQLDLETGRFTYYGDNRRPGHRLHETARGGNELLRACFDAHHASPPRRQDVPPFFIFTGTGEGRNVRFRGLAVPGARDLSATDDLVAVWKTAGNERFQNYRAAFTVLDVPIVTREWLVDILGGRALSERVPAAFREWVDRARYKPLTAERTITWRSRAEQLPATSEGVEIIRVIHRHFEATPHEFERCAALLAQWMDSNIVAVDVTRPWMDGGRDAVGRYRIGSGTDSILVDFALEAKCYAISNGNGVKHSSRLISRLRFRQSCGIFVTTSYLDDQAYREIRLDGHSGDCSEQRRRIVRLLASKGNCYASGCCGVAYTGIPRRWCIWPAGAGLARPSRTRCVFSGCGSHDLPLAPSQRFA